MTARKLHELMPVEREMALENLTEALDICEMPRNYLSLLSGFLDMLIDMEQRHEAKREADHGAHS